MFGDEVPLRARVEVLNGYSAHADRTELATWLGAVRKPSPGLRRLPGPRRAGRTGRVRGAARPNRTENRVSDSGHSRDGMRRVALLLALGAQAASAQAAQRPAQIAVVGSDYAFIGFPTTIAAGPTLFSFENRGEVRHEMTMILLSPA